MAETQAVPEQRSAGMDMLHGSLAKKIFLFALPIAASGMLQQLFNSADVAVAGQFAEPGALAAVGANGAVVSLLINLLVGLSVGANVAISLCIGQRKTEEVGTYVHTSMAFSLLCGLVMVAVGLLLSRPLLILIDTPADVLDRAVLYLRIYCLGMLAIIPYNFGAAILRSIGDTKRPLYCLIASGFLNVGLNLLLVVVFHLDVAGVAIATVVSNVFSTAVIFFILCREKGIVHLNLRSLKLDGRALRRMLSIGAPAALQSSVFSISNICLQTAINGFGSDAVGGVAAALNIEFLTFFVITAFGQASTTFIGQNYGARQYGRCKKIIRLCLVESILGTLFFSAVFVLGREPLIRIFTTQPREIDYALLRLLYGTPLIFVANGYEVTGSALRGMGRSLLPALLTVVGTVVFRLAWVYLAFPRWPNFIMLIIVYPLSWLLTTIMVGGAYLLLRKRLYGGPPLPQTQ